MQAPPKIYQKSENNTELKACQLSGDLVPYSHCFDLVI